jgi:hypothetical protein
MLALRISGIPPLIGTRHIRESSLAPKLPALRPTPCALERARLHFRLRFIDAKSEAKFAEIEPRESLFVANFIPVFIPPFPFLLDKNAIRMLAVISPDVRLNQVAPVELRTMRSVK